MTLCLFGSLPKNDLDHPRGHGLYDAAARAHRDPARSREPQLGRILGCDEDKHGQLCTDQRLWFGRTVLFDQAAEQFMVPVGGENKYPDKIGCIVLIASADNGSDADSLNVVKEYILVEYNPHESAPALLKMRRGTPFSLTLRYLNQVCSFPNPK